MYLINEGLFSQLCQVPGFNEEYGHTYRDYLIKTLLDCDDISPDIKEILRDIQESDTIFKILQEYQVEYSISSKI
jgi:hypothetical protein